MRDIIVNVNKCRKYGRIAVDEWSRNVALIIIVAS